MSNLLQSGAAWLAAQLKANASSPVTYRRGGSLGSRVSLNAVKGATKQEVSSNDGAIVGALVDDYLIDAADILIENVVVEPQPGDQIVEADGSVYEVMDLGTSEGCWRWMNAYHITRRIHTKQVKAST